MKKKFQIFTTIILIATAFVALTSIYSIKSFSTINGSDVVSGEALSPVEISIVPLASYQASSQEIVDVKLVEQREENTFFAENEPQAIQFIISEDAKAELSEREIKEQKRDWLMMLSARNLITDTARLNEVLYDTPGLRYGYIKPLGNFQFGETRSLSVGEGNVLVLLPTTATDNEREDYLRIIADKQRKMLATMPQQFIIFDYSLDEISGNAILTQRETISAQVYFTEEHGFYSQNVRSIADMDEFLTNVDMLTAFKVGYSDITLDGRQLIRDYLGVTSEYVATLYQSQVYINKTYADWEALHGEDFVNEWQEYEWDLSEHFGIPVQRQGTAWNNSDTDALRVYCRQELTKPNPPDTVITACAAIMAQSFNLATPQSIFGSTPTPPIKENIFDKCGEVLLSDNPNDDDLKTCSKLPYLPEGLTYEDAQRLLNYYKVLDFAAQGIDTSSGFSLDPQYDYDGLVKYYKENRDSIEQFIKDNALTMDTSRMIEAEIGIAKEPPDPVPLLNIALEFQKAEPLARLQVYDPQLQEAVRDGSLTYEDYSQLQNYVLVEDHLALSNALLYVSLDHPEIYEDFFDVVDYGANLEQTIRGFQYQSARYDGKLQGTEVGMTLFYTDLLAKLWGIDYKNTLEDTPAGNIDDFLSLPQVEIPLVYRYELAERSNTRLWFGHREEAFQTVGSDTLLFELNATRVYAASSNTSIPGLEWPSNAVSDRFLGWWDDHYEEIARFEPEYERLNEIMKWSIVVSWVFERDRQASISYLDKVTVNDSLWFPDWVEDHKELRYSNWDAIGFYEEGHLGASTETLPRLISDVPDQFGRVWQGGVTLPSQGVIAERLPMVGDVPEFMRSSHVIEFKGTTPDLIELATLDNRRMNLTKLADDVSELRIKPDEYARLRGDYGDVAPGEFTRTITQNDDNMTVLLKADQTDVAVVGMQKTSNGFLIGMASRDMDRARGLALQLSVAEDPVLVLRSSTEVDSFIIRDHDYFVKLRGTDDMLQIAVEGTPTINVEGDWLTRVSGRTTDSENLLLRWIKADELPTTLADPSSCMCTDPRLPAETPILVNGKPEALPETPYLLISSDGDVRWTAMPQSEEGKVVSLHLYNNVEVKATYDSLSDSYIVPVDQLPSDYLLASDQIADAIKLSSPGSNEIIIGDVNTLTSHFDSASAEVPYLTGDIDSIQSQLLKDPSKTVADIRAFRDETVNDIVRSLDADQTINALIKLNDLKPLYGDSFDVIGLETLVYGSLDDPVAMARALNDLNATRYSFGLELEELFTAYAANAPDHIATNLNKAKEVITFWQGKQAGQFEGITATAVVNEGTNTLDVLLNVTESFNSGTRQAVGSIAPDNMYYRPRATEAISGETQTVGQPVSGNTQPLEDFVAPDAETAQAIRLTEAEFVKDAEGIEYELVTAQELGDMGYNINVDLSEPSCDLNDDDDSNDCEVFFLVSTQSN